MAAQPFPIKCPNCRERQVGPVKEEYRTTLEHDGRSYEINISDLEFLKCAACGNLQLDDAADVRVNAALRAGAGLLSPEEIRGGRIKLGLTQKAFADLLGIAEATMSRWETGGQIQQRHSDVILCAFFECPEFRDFLKCNNALADDGAECSTKPKVMETSLAELPVLN